MKYWLMKSEPSTFSISDLKKVKKEHWDGVRNYQARNFMMKEMSVNDQVLFYHSNCEVPGIYGLAKVCSKSYPDPTQFKKTSDYYDPKSTKDKPRWYLVDVCFVREFKKPVSLSELKELNQFKDMLVTQKGSRLSIQPVSKKHFDAILKLCQKRN